MERRERELIQTALGGDADAFELLMTAYGLRVYAVAYAILADRQEAEDCAQDTFFKAWRARGQSRDPDKFCAWLLTVARHAARDRLRRRAARPATVPLDLAAEPEADAAAAPDDQTERNQRVQALLATLPERHRVALTLRYMDGLDHRAIERAMDLSNGALRGISSRAIESLRHGLHRATSLSDAL